MLAVTSIDYLFLQAFNVKNRLEIFTIINLDSSNKDAIDDIN